MPETLLVIDDEKLICWSLKKEFEKKGFTVFTANNAADGLQCFFEQDPDIVLLDIRLPDKSGTDVLKEIRKAKQDAIVIMITSYSGIEGAVTAIKDGAYDYIEKPFQLERVEISINRAIEKIHLNSEIKTLSSKDRDKYSFDRIYAHSDGMMQVLSLARKIAATDYATVLLQGESGTGKDLMAQTIHYESVRKFKRYVEINCSAMPDTLIESELFGYEKGAFTDAKQARKGLFEIADGGTVYIDEIGDVKLPIQVKLLRVLEEKRFRHVGGHKDINMDVRIIAATNKDLEAEVEKGNFRKDLFFRLKVIPICIPPLRERREDIIAIAQSFIAHFNTKFRKNVASLAEDTEQILLNYHWPGNVRELRNIIEHVVLLSDSDIIHPHHLPEEISKENSHRQSADATAGGLCITVPEAGVDLAEIEKEYIRQALITAGGNQTRAARLLNVTRDVLRYRMQRLEL